MKSYLSPTLLGLCFVAAPSFVTAQPTNDLLQAQTKLAVEENSEEAASLLSSSGPNDRVNAGYVHPDFEISRSDDSTEISFGFSLDMENNKPVKSEQGFYQINRTQLSLFASTPIEDSNAGNIFSGDNLVGGTKIRLSLSNLYNELGTGANSRKLLQDAYFTCLNASLASWMNSAPDDAQRRQTAEYFRNEIGKIQRGGGVFPNSIPSGKNPIEKQLSQKLHMDCEPYYEGGTLKSDDELFEKYTNNASEYRRSFFNERSNPIFWGLDAMIGHKKFTYLDNQSFSMQDVQKTSWEFGAYGGQISQDADSSLRFSASIGRTYEAAKVIEDCRMVEGLAEPKCLMGPGGAPQTKIDGLISVESRSVFSWGDKTEIGFAPQISYRVNDDAFLFEVPIYLPNSKSSGLDGGIKFGYDTSKNDFALGIFIGIPLDITFGT